MNATPTVPTTVTAEAASRMDELGIRADVDQMVEQARQMVPGLRRLEVIAEPAWDGGDGPYITIQALVDPSTESAAAEAWRQWSHWLCRVFPGKAGEYSQLMIYPETGHAG